MISTDPKSIVKIMQDAADAIAINPSDLESTESIDEVYAYLCGEILPSIVEQLGFMQGLREKLRVKEYAND